MLKDDQIIEILREGKGYFSGSQIAKTIGISRAAVWKRIKALRDRGYKIEGQPTKGYKLVELPDLSIETIRAILKKDSIRIGSELIFYETVNSTNLIASELASKGYGEGVVIIADEQTAGRGRLGRKWQSPKGKNLYFSLILTPPILPINAPILTLLSGVACCNALRKLFSIPITIKWPNDLILEDRKIGGILTEIKADIDKIIYAIVGIGININSEIEDFTPELREIATSLKLYTKRDSSRTDILITLLKEFQFWYDIFLNEGKEKIILHWQNLSSTIGKRVKAQVWNDTFVGVAESIDNNGMLVIRLENNSSVKINAGDITMLRDEKLS